MQRRWYVTTLALVAACTESAPPPTGPSLELPDQPEHVFWARGQGPAAPLGLMTGHGGDLMLASKTYAIYWGGDWNTPAFAGDKITGLTSFFQGWGGSAYAGALTEYGGQKWVFSLSHVPGTLREVAGPATKGQPLAKHLGIT